MAIAVGVNERLDPTVLSSSNTSGTGNNAQDLQNQFLTMLVTQLKNQDPTNPMDNSQLTTQLAQINTLSGIEKLNTTLGSISGQISTSQSLQSSTLIGHGVMVNGGQVLVGNGTTTPFGVELASASTGTSATIKDASGTVIDTVDLGALSAGVHTFSWDGKLTDGSVAPDGKYSVAIAASNGNTQLVAQPLNYAYVNGVSTANNTTKLDLGTMGSATLDDVRQIL
ncbi:flagellar hook assembly protein FlgD [Pantoea agglomerans]|jgi:flagellar basal-body rod modification protein FlgD|uniref:Flagellar hook assembly protein FlgD n=2 Tax=Pantoea TaxID=53335 RepID=A0ACC5PTP3_ENTAG|nr:MULTISPECIES: flagellar hook assembly protein FlgD [Pantoea]MDF9910068.1 flagellar basal-body rod modification protein FlgD [Pantoea brenneri]AYP23707.1 flagellar hook assembly protein FlgD [Pantoea agglomerans]ERM07364.1 flagellar basal body rod modification protein [Pantoea agglomerans Tx10]EZI33864.1 Flagellar basal body rod modification protein [Pantoea agglomerans]KAF6639676.1 flagellar hook assembly protein FlgD [Pantoea sp. EKM10T]